MSEKDMQRTLVIDIGGTNVKLKLQNHEEIKKLGSGPDLTPETMVQSISEIVREWKPTRITIGYPGPVVKGKIHLEPANLGRGWVGFDFEAAFQLPLKIINDAAMQAMGSYQGGRMLFLGLGTGLGTTFIINNLVAPLELGHLPYRKKMTFEQWVGAAGLDRLGKNRWQKAVHDVVTRLRDAFIADYVVLGGGNAKKLDEVPPGCRVGDNKNAFLGGERVWEGDFTF
jgi:polyphosphate glucokinase